MFDRGRATSVSSYSEIRYVSVGVVERLETYIIESRGRPNTVIMSKCNDLVDALRIENIKYILRHAVIAVFFGISWFGSASIS